MNELAEKIVELRIATRSACMCENTDNNKKSTLSLKTKVLFCIDKGYSSKDITLALCIAKTNLALITASLCKEGLVIKTRNPSDKREIIYSLTEQGHLYLDRCLEIIEARFKNLFGKRSAYKDTVKKLSDALDILSFVNY